MSEELVLGAMEKYHIDYMLVSNGDASEVDHNQLILLQQCSIREAF